ncbi:hypothetical protein LCGC14_2053040 [marine sediment metagenome]|uniref:HNH nuclease domain-containing protein n=1 Tax=marine sediment metagenome TaxID=412755 RepID=A0A0F9FAW2_9ZZZZ
MKNEYLLDKLNEAASLFSHPISRTDLKNLRKNNVGFPSESVYESRFGSWNKAKSLAGLDLIPKHGAGTERAGRKKYKEKWLLEKLHEARVFLGRDLRRNDMKDLCKLKIGFPSSDVYENRFGSWNKALVIAGLPIWKKSRSPNNRNVTLHLRFEVLERDRFKCQYCGRTPQDGAKLVADHIVPFSKGGKTVLENLITSCFECNSGKKDSILDILAQKKKASQ